MRAVDTNVLIRFLTGDDADQHAQAEAVIAAGQVMVSVTVVLETEWVLRRSYRYTPAQVCTAIRNLAGLPDVNIEQPEAFAQALTWLATGMDFADALHLARARNCEAFVTFDRDLIRRAKRLGTLPVRAP